MKKKFSDIEILKRWLSGKQDLPAVTDQEDPFLSDAIKGFQQFPDGNHLERITEIKLKIRKQHSKKQGWTGLKWSIAASILVSSIALMYYFSNPVRQNELTLKVNESTLPALKKEEEISLDDRIPDLKESDEVAPALSPKFRKESAVAPSKKIDPPREVAASEPSKLEETPVTIDRYITKPTYESEMSQDLELPVKETMTPTEEDQSGSMLSEIVVGNPGNREKRKSESARAKKDSSPAASNTEDLWLDYISKNLVYPKEALENNIQGSVFLKFSISSKGELKNISVSKSLGYGCDEEAIRLLQNAPTQILPIKFNRKKQTLKVDFKPE